jgi:hypothetical protein
MTDTGVETEMKLVVVGLLSVVSFLILSACTTLATVPISEIDCQSLADEWEGDSLRNMFGAENKILKIREPVVVSRNERELVCRGKGRTENGSMDFRMTLSEDSDGERWHEIKAIP